jgi:hypothetical protein
MGTHEDPGTEGAREDPVRRWGPTVTLRDTGAHEGPKGRGATRPVHRRTHLSLRSARGALGPGFETVLSGNCQWPNRP